jgi:NAD(P)-dependent dehydrogenase (short-subunit alcohol dehydrogenase family)
MTERVALITGAVGGIGSATVALFRREGWHVIGMDRDAEEAADADRFVATDLGDDKAVAAAIEELGDLQHLDALVNNAAISADDWDQVMAVNLRAAFLTTRHALPLLRAGRGSVVNVSSVHAFATARGVPAYAASKGGLVALTRAQALDLAADGIRVNTVIPGAIDTPMLRHSPDDNARVVEIAARTPLSRIGQPAEVAQAILFLADGDRSSFITGAALTVDGGALARLSTE